jgi:endonuclease-3
VPPLNASATGPKKPHDIGVMLQRISAAVASFRKAAMFELAEMGFTSPFEQLVACIISIRSLDEVTLPAAQRLFAQARTPAAVMQLSAAQVDRLIRPATFHDRKAEQILAIARRVEAEFGGQLPCERDIMLSFAGVGPKCANLALGIACGAQLISVDVHVHRVTNRWGYVATSTPEKTIDALAHKLPEQYWLDINRLLVPFGKHICTGQLPRCSTCPVLEYCRQVGVTAHR